MRMHLKLTCCCGALLEADVDYRSEMVEMMNLFTNSHVNCREPKDGSTQVEVLNLDQ